MQPPVRPSAVLAARYTWAFSVAVVIVVVAWHVAGAGSQLAGSLRDYSSAGVQVAAWAVMALVIAAGAVRLLRGAAGPGWAWGLCVVVLVAGAIATAACPPDRMLATDWAWGSMGWTGVLVLLRRPLAELAGFLAMAALVTLSVLVRDDPHRLALAGFFTVLFASAGIQFAVWVGARALDVTARRAADAAEHQAGLSARKVIADRVYAARRSRWLAVHGALEPLLAGLADGSADPGDPGARGRCAVEAARLRRLFAESDDSPDPLVHELHASADIAQRRGVAVDVEAVGVIPVMPLEVRRAITDVAIAALTAAFSKARITVTAADDGVAVSFVTDAPDGSPVPAAGPGLAVEAQRDREDLWLEVRWDLR
ncbi:MAG TPA: hypothetical protein VGS19_37570 [Streptosporangiaceae bacterium]|nr:hypothetical protein [Streptosporangiaceae bacterium]